MAPSAWVGQRAILWVVVVVFLLLLLVEEMCLMLEQLLPLQVRLVAQDVILVAEVLIQGLVMQTAARLIILELAVDYVLLADTLHADATVQTCPVVVLR